jgi:repressor LexA
MEEGLTQRQRQVLRLIRSCIADSGLPPTRAEICQAMGFNSPNAAEEHLRALERKGVIEMLAGASRGIRLKEGFGLPLIGRVGAGTPLLAIENVEARFQIDPQLFAPAADYLLKVKGMSMRDAGILDGDLLAVHRTHEARSGQVVVARLHDEVTVKRLKRRGAVIQLLPENPDFQPIEVDARDETFAIEGLAVGIIRNSKPL